MKQYAFYVQASPIVIEICSVWNAIRKRYRCGVSDGIFLQSGYSVSAAAGAGTGKRLCPGLEKEPGSFPGYAVVYRTCERISGGNHAGQSSRELTTKKVFTMFCFSELKSA